MKIDKQKLFQGLLLILAAFLGGAGALGAAYQLAPETIELGRDIETEFAEQDKVDASNKEQALTFLPGTYEWEHLDKPPSKEELQAETQYLYEVEARWVQTNKLKGGGGGLPVVEITATDRYDHTSRARSNLQEKHFKLLKPVQLNALLAEPLPDSRLEHVHSIRLIGTTPKE